MGLEGVDAYGVVRNDFPNLFKVLCISLEDIDPAVDLQTDVRVHFSCSRL